MNCVHLKYAGGRQALCSVENIDVLSRYGEGAESVWLEPSPAEKLATEAIETEGTHPGNCP